MRNASLPISSVTKSRNFYLCEKNWYWQKTGFNSDYKPISPFTEKCVTNSLILELFAVKSNKKIIKPK